MKTASATAAKRSKSNPEPPVRSKAFKYTFEAFGNKDFVYTTRDSWDQVTDKIIKATGCATAVVLGFDSVSVTAFEYTEHSFAKLESKRRV